MYYLGIAYIVSVGCGITALLLAIYVQIKVMRTPVTVSLFLTFLGLALIPLINIASLIGTWIFYLIETNNAILLRIKNKLLKFLDTEVISTTKD